jgi:hypothetical protein
LFNVKRDYRPLTKESCGGMETKKPHPMWHLGGAVWSNLDSRYYDAMIATMRTTVTLDQDVVAYLKAYMREKGLSFKEALNQAVRNGLSKNPKTKRPFRQKTYDMGTPVVPLRKALRIAAELEDEEILRDLAIRK